MWVIFVEASFAMLVFVFIVWWTMFSGKEPEPPQENASSEQDKTAN